MPCRVGMTTNLDNRLAYWERQVHGMDNIQYWGPFDTKTEAQKVETNIAEQYYCVHHGGGSGPENADWYVYYFEYTRKK